MFDLYEEFNAIISVLTERGIEYAVCGGMAMAVHGAPRATVDIDLLIPADRLEEAKNAARSLSYTIEALPMTFAKKQIEIRRVSKIDADTGIVLSLDLLLVTPQIMDIWNSRTEVAWESRVLSVVSREGLIALKSLRSSSQDVADIERLKELDNEG
jgi:nucleotidyltransferase AbiEii toxin of type IV toxin-antitoxin system